MELLYAIDTTYHIPHTTYHRLGLILSHNLFYQLGMTHIQLVSMATVNNGLSSVERHTFQVIENRGPESKDPTFGFHWNIICWHTWGLLSKNSRLLKYSKLPVLPSEVKQWRCQVKPRYLTPHSCARYFQSNLCDVIWGSDFRAKMIVTSRVSKAAWHGLTKSAVTTSILVWFSQLKVFWKLENELQMTVSSVCLPILV